ncbi:MAG: hypothetical protein QNJ13_14805 [Paracoccaceae bacterium]|nr:hypothetical protein [Paracoccaceae bacterium]
MTDGPERSASTRRHRDSGAVTSLASQALSVLATRRVPRDARATQTLIAKLEAAVLDRNPDRRMAVLAEIRSMRIPDAQVAEEFIPEVARRLGHAWCEDNMSFADVTIGSARLQAMVRDLSPDDRDYGAGPAPLIAVIVPGEEHHTLGAMVLTAQLRRLGFSVRLFLGKGDGYVLEALGADTFDAIFLSAAHGEKLVKLGGFVKKMRQAVSRATPIIVGGSAVARGVAIEGYVGADVFTSDVHEALNACGLKTFHKDERRLATMTETTSPNF